MLFPDGIGAKETVYWTAAMIMKFLKENEERNWLKVYKSMKEELDTGIKLFCLSLNWLYLIDKIDTDFYTRKSFKWNWNS
ncbi:ABC-three component system middle component 6 [Mycoplasma procyoni]|uniref:ABC-three component system middle component 6 n=1 Tax=Mycoplasma procyoni TaxID=568784 RepID=UPI00197B9FE2|nr:ABC-three component system middle component 6 [Mycoplasma procyoni]MBN3534665.1 hypothetical protein [Mycoplasma procyoni]